MTFMNQEDAYRAYDCVRKEFPGHVNFEACPWIETKTGWARSNQTYLLEVTPTKVKVSGPPFGEHLRGGNLADWEQEWSVYQLTADDFSIDPPLSEAPIG